MYVCIQFQHGMIGSDVSAVVSGCGSGLQVMTPGLSMPDGRQDVLLLDLWGSPSHHMMNAQADTKVMKTRLVFH